MTKNKQLSQQNGRKSDAVTLPRRGFIQRVALMSGVFVTGVLRLDKAFAGDEGVNCNVYSYKCCSLYSPHSSTCDLSSCASHLYWICPADGVLYRCVECYNVKHGKSGATKISGCTDPDLCDDVKCSRAIHPREPDYQIFDNN